MVAVHFITAIGAYGYKNSTFTGLNDYALFAYKAMTPPCALGQRGQR